LNLAYFSRKVCPYR